MTEAAARNDRVVGILFVIVLLLLVSGLLGAHWVFAYGLVVWLGVLAGLGFVRSGDLRTWIAAALVFTGLGLGMTGVLLNESAVISDVADTVLGFHPGTAALVYGIWIPGFFTLGVGFVLLFDRIVKPGRNPS
jgi:Na+/melibiose symporter-like transporter